MNYKNEIIRKDMRELSLRKLPYEELRGSSILITGASGMLASYLVYFFMYLNETRNCGIKITALVRNEKKAWDNLETFREKSELLSHGTECM